MANDLKSWAEAGARARLLDIHTETTTILRIFPDLRKGAAATIRRRRAMSQAERKAVGERARVAHREKKALAPGPDHLRPLEEGNSVAASPSVPLLYGLYQMR